MDEGGCLLVTYESRWSSVHHNMGIKNFNTECDSLIQYRDWKNTAGYLAPELLSPLAQPTNAADWWSVGALMYHLLTGQVSIILIIYIIFIVYGY